MQVLQQCTMLMLELAASAEPAEDHVDVVGEEAYGSDDEQHDQDSRKRGAVRVQLDDEW